VQEILNFKFFFGVIGNSIKLKKNLAGKISWVNQFSVEANGIGYSSTGNRRMRRG
jgi:hypothetical protein